MKLLHIFAVLCSLLTATMAAETTTLTPTDTTSTPIPNTYTQPTNTTGTNPGPTPKNANPAAKFLVVGFFALFIFVMIFGKSRRHHDGFVTVEHHAPPPMHMDVGGVQLNLGGHGGFRGGHH